MIVLPEGIYHRFTLDEHDYIKVRTEAARADAHTRAEGGLQQYQRQHISTRPGFTVSWGRGCNSMYAPHRTSRATGCATAPQDAVQH
jgi:ARD/ARD' family